MHKELDDYIVKTKGLEGQDLLPQKILALQVELGECANEWRGFKFWSKNQTPKNKESKQCSGCRGFGLKTKYIDDNGIATMKCEKCKGKGEIPHNPLLEEYVDCIHFFLSIAINNWWEDSMYVSEEAIEETKEQGLDGGVTGALLECMYWLMKMYMENKPNDKIESMFNISTKEFYFRQAWYVFIVTGIVGFGFTLEQIEQAYTDKWNINKQRQENGY
jgi:dimeric dUTPase (all-alpha-NTP-PPase superfamily)